MRTISGDWWHLEVIPEDGDYSLHLLHCRLWKSIIFIFQNSSWPNFGTFLHCWAEIYVHQRIIHSRQCNVESWEGLYKVINRHIIASFLFKYLLGISGLFPPCNTFHFFIDRFLLLKMKEDMKIDGEVITISICKEYYPMYLSFFWILCHDLNIPGCTCHAPDPQYKLK